MEKPSGASGAIEQGVLLYEDSGQHLTVAVGTFSWYTWLETATTFTFACADGTFTAHKVRAGNQRGGWYWRASRFKHGRTFRCYLGISSNLTLSYLQEAARRLAVRAEEPYGKITEDARQETRALPPSAVLTPLPIVQTKSAVPRLPVAHVPRARLVALLERGAALPFTLLSAPAGSGKTTLLAEWARATTMPVAWLSLEPADSDPVRFLSYVLAALRTLDTRIGQEARKVLDAQPVLDLERFLSELSNELDAFLTTDGVLVLDDYQVLENETVDACLLFLLEHLPQRLHLMVGTRVDLPLPLARLRTRGQMNEIRADALRFAAIEMQFFLHQMEIDLDEEALDRLEERTEGWIAGVQLAALALRGRSDHEAFLRAFRGTHQLLLEYLGEEILTRVTPQMRAFLLQTSILKHLSGSLCDAVTGETGSQSILEALRKANLFVSALGEAGAWYRYHPLFAEGLRHLLAQHEPELFPQLCARASSWYEAHEMLFEACEYALQASDVLRAVSLIERQVGKLVGDGQFFVLQRWLEQLSPDSIAASPLLSVASAQVLVVNSGQFGHLEQTAAELQQRFQAPVKETDQAQWTEAQTNLSLMRILQALDENEVERAFALASHMFQDLPEGATSLRSLASLCLCLTQGMVHRSRGDFAAAERALIQATTQICETDYHYLNLVAMGCLTEMYEVRGELRKSEHLSRRFLSLFRARKDSPREPLAGIGLNYANLLVEWNRLDEAEETLKQALLDGHSIQMKGFTLDGHFLQLRLCQVREQYEEALTWFQKIEKELADLPLSHPMGGFAALVRARLLLAQGQLEEAALWLGQCGLNVDDPLPEEPLKEPIANDEMRFAEYMVLARVLIAQGRVSPRETYLTQALTMLERLRALSEKAGLTRRVIEILVLMSLALQAQGETQTALVQLERAVTLAAPGGFVRLFADEGEPMARLLARVSAQKPSTIAYLQTLRDAVSPGSLSEDNRGQQHSLSVAHPSLAEPLSPREMEVLRELSTGASNQEIAARLVIAPTTAKRHVKHILAKLAVTNRVQAVARVRELHLL